MSSKGRKIAKNLGKSLRKKFDSDSQTDDLQQYLQREADLNISRSSPTHSGCSVGADMKASGAAAPAAPIGKSTSLSTIGNDPADPVIVDHNEIIALTHDVKHFSDTLARMKMLFIDGLEPGDDARVVLQESLGEVLAVLKSTLLRYPALQSPEIFTTARALINKVRSHDQEELQPEEEELQVFLDTIDQVALAFSRSVSEYLMGDIVTQQQLNAEAKEKVKSCDNIAKAAQEEEQAAEKQEPKKTLTPAELDAILVGLEAGLDLGLQRAKAWSRYTRDIITYIEKKSQLELEYAKNLARIANSMQPVLTTEGFLPLQSVFCTALSQDTEFSSNLQASQALLHTSKFVEPLASRRSEHDRVRKTVKETWDRELRRMQDTVNNLRKAQALYISRQQDLERVRETLQKADGDKMEKRKKAEEEAMHKSAEAETTYKACVAEANHRQRSLERNKVELLAKIREQIHMCDQVIKSVTVEYFSLLHTVWSPVPVQYQTLCESSSGYEAGCQYAEFIKRLPSSASKPCRTDEFAFEPYFPGQKTGEARKISVHSNGSSGEHVNSTEGSPLSSPRRDKWRIPVKAWGQTSGQPAAQTCGSDTDSGSNMSHESSPSSSPHDLLRRQIITSQSMDDLAEEDPDRLPSAAHVKRGKMKRMNTVGGEDTLDLPNQRGRRNTMFGVDFQEQVERYRSQVPPIITQCLAEIERRGVMIKGIYRVSGVKSKVESLCQRFDLNPELVDLEEVHPNIISNVLKLYLRQLPEPLLTFRLYSEFIHMAKENMAGSLLGDKIVERIASLVRKLPPSNFRTCAVLMHHLHRVAAHCDLNQMSSSNLGIVFGPTLLRPLEGTASLASLVDTPHQTRAIELLITHAEAVFGPGDDYQLVPDQTPVEAMEKTADGLRITVPSSTSEPSPEKSPTKDSSEAVPSPGPPSTALSPCQSSSLSSVAAVAMVAAPLASQVDDSAVLVTDTPVPVPSLEPSAADFTLPGSASQDKDDNVFIDNPTSDGRGPSWDCDAASLSSTLDDDDDELTEAMLPDQSHDPHSHTHTPLLTPHCIADWKPPVQEAAALIERRPPAEAGKEGAAAATLRPPLADMEPAGDTTLPAPDPTLVDCSTWPGRGAGVSLPASPSLSSPTPSLSSDGRLSPTKGGRADLFKLEQRKLLSAIKSDPKLGMGEGEGEALEEEGGGVEGGPSTASVAQAAVSAKESGPLTGAPSTLKEDKGKGVGARPSSAAETAVGTAGPDKGKAKGRKVAERSDSLGKLPGSPARTGIRLGTRSSSPRTELTASKSGLQSMTGKYTALSASKARPTTTTTSSAVQRGNAITGLNATNSASSPALSAPSRSVLSRYPPAPTTTTSSRRPVSSAPTSSPSRSSSGSSSLSSPRRPASSATFESSLRSSQPEGIQASCVRTRRVSGEKGVGGGSPREGGPAAQGRSGTAGSGTKLGAGSRTGSGGHKNWTGSSKATSTASKTPSGAATAGTKLPASAPPSGVVKETCGVPPASGGMVATATGNTTSSVGDSPTCASDKDADQGDAGEMADQPQSLSTKDLSSDRTPRFV